MILTVSNEIQQLLSTGHWQTQAVLASPIFFAKALSLLATL
jgi:hypothetical protein